MAVVAVPLLWPCWPSVARPRRHGLPALLMQTRLASWCPLDHRELDGLMVLVADGDQMAFAQVYDRLAPTVFGVARRVLRDAAQAEEVAQEVFVELWRHATRFDGSRGSVRTLAVTIAHRRAVDRVRSEQAHRTRVVRMGAIAGSAEQTPEDTAVDVEDRRRAADALARLTDVQREALELAFYEGLTQVQIADQLGVALGTVKTRIRDGLIRLRDSLGGGHE
jgi:RNA polymerase sigma-70 factor (ECF subfamily)